jgi:predicted membrane-bound dolichyl-phosphate-mannose-protein mannosyltransferase
VRSTESDRLLRKLSAVQLLTNYTLLVGAFTLSATILLVNDKIILAIVVAGLAAILSLFILRLMRRLDRYDRQP